MISLPFFRKKEEKIVYFGVMVTDTITSGFIFDLVGKDARIITQSSAEATPVYDQILQALDTVISEIESTEKVSVHQTIYFLYSSQLDPQTHDIREPYKGILKKSAAELALKPLGYIDMHESVAGYLKKRAVVHYLLVEVDQHTVSIFMYKGSIPIWSAHTARTSSVAADMKSLLETAPADTIFPSKLFLYGNGDMTSISNEIAAYQWDEKIFAQHPVIEVVKEGTIMQVLADACAIELIGEGSPQEKSVSPAPAPAATPTDDLFGFVVGKDIANQPLPLQSSMSDYEVVGPMPISEPISKVPPPLPVSAPLDTSNTSWVQSQLSFLSRFSGVKTGITATAGSGLAIILILICGFLAFEYFFHMATIEVQVPSRSLSVDTTLDIPIAEDTQSSSLSAMKKTQSKELSDSLAVTGKREVGEKAKGQVVVHNFDNSEKNINKGAKLQSGSYVFILDNDVKVASSSGITSEGVKQSGKAKASVTAEAIGPEYNLKSGTQLTIDGLSQSLFVAFADGAFSGGTKKQVTTVSKSDIDELKKKASDEAKKYSQKDVDSLVGKDEVLIDDLSEVVLADTSFSKEVGEEAKEVALTASSDIVFYTVKKIQLEKALFSLLEKKQTGGYRIQEKSLKYNFEKAALNENEDAANVSVKAKAVEIKEISLDLAKKAVAHKMISSLPEAAKHIDSAQGAEMLSQKPSLPLIKWTPLFSKNITIRVDSP